MIKKFLRRAATLGLALSLVVTQLTPLVPLTPKVAKAAGSDIVVGNTYSFGGYDWIAAEVGSDYAVLQSKGVTKGSWPGYWMSGTITNAAGNSIDLGSSNSWYGCDIDGYDISSYYSNTQELYNNIKAFEKTGMSYGKGLFLVSRSKAGATTDGNRDSNYYNKALKEAAANCDSFGGTYTSAWLGTVYGGSGAWCVNSSGYVSYNSEQDISFVVAPAFNLDKSKVTVSGNNINIKHSLSYDVATNGGTSAAPETISEIEPNIVYDSNSPALKATALKEGWTFVGWNTDKDAHEALTSLTMDSDKKLYAIFKKDLTITFKDVGN